MATSENMKGFANKKARGDEFKRLPQAHMAMNGLAGYYAEALFLQDLSLCHFAT